MKILCTNIQQKICLYACNHHLDDTTQGAQMQRWNELGHAETYCYSIYTIYKQLA